MSTTATPPTESASKKSGKPKNITISLPAIDDALVSPATRRKMEKLLENARQLQGELQATLSEQAQAEEKNEADRIRIIGRMFRATMVADPKANATIVAQLGSYLKTDKERDLFGLPALAAESPT